MPVNRIRFIASRAATNRGALFAIVALTVLALRVIQNWLCRIGTPAAWDYGPAQLAIRVDSFAAGASLYRDFRVAPCIPLVYGPVVPALTGALVPLFGTGAMAALEAGRTLTLASTLVVCASIYFLARRTGANQSAALLATLGFILSPIVLRWGFEYRVDMPVLATQLVGVLAYADGAAAIGILLFVVSFFIKQGHAVGIATVLLYCWISRQRRRAYVIGLIWITAVAAGTAILAEMYPFYFLNQFGAVRTVGLDFSAPLFFLMILLGANLGLTIFTILAITRSRLANSLILCWLVVAAIHDVVSCLRWGSNAYYFLPMLAGLAILAATGIDLLLARLRAMSTIHQLGAGAGLALLLALGFIFAPRPFAPGLRAIAPRCETRIADLWDPRALEMLRSIRGPILTDAAELKLVDQRQNLQWIDLMVLTSMWHLGSFDDQALLDSIRHRQVAAFALDSEGLERSFRGRALFWPRLREAIEDNYELAPAEGPPLVLLPKKTPAGALRN